MNGRQLSRQRHEYRKRIPSNMTWLQLDEAVYRFIAQKETYGKLADESIRLYPSTVADALHIPRDYVELSIKELIRQKRLAPYEYRLITMKRAEAVAAQLGRGVHEIFKYPTPDNL
jgi:predicted regulator of amino acid metabolism with ACT domain